MPTAHHSIITTFGGNTILAFRRIVQEFALLTVSVEKALAYFATHPETVLGLFGLYCEESVILVQLSSGIKIL